MEPTPLTLQLDFMNLQRWWSLRAICSLAACAPGANCRKRVLTSFVSLLSATYRADTTQLATTARICDIFATNFLNFLNGLEIHLTRFRHHNVDSIAKKLRCPTQSRLTLLRIQSPGGPKSQQFPHQALFIAAMQ
jgi:hypothetical protein